MTLPFNFDDYAIKEEKNQQQTPTQEPPKQQQPLDFNKFLAEEEKSIFQKYEIGRHATRTGARALETVIGLPGDFVQFAKYLGDKLPEPPKFLQREPSFVQKAGRKALETLPTSQELQETSSYLTSG